jgi:hypothetical protein
MTKKYLKDKVLDLLRYSEVLLTTMTKESERINANVDEMLGLINKGENFDNLFDNYKFDRIYYNLFEGEIIKVYANVAELYKLAKDEGVEFSKEEIEKLETILKQEEDAQFFAFVNDEVVPKNEEVVKLMKDHISKQDNSTLKEQFVRDARENFDKMKEQAKVVDYNSVADVVAPAVEEIAYEEVE